MTAGDRLRAQSRLYVKAIGPLMVICGLSILAAYAFWIDLPRHNTAFAGVDVHFTIDGFWSQVAATHPVGSGWPIFPMLMWWAVVPVVIVAAVMRRLWLIPVILIAAFLAQEGNNAWVWRHGYSITQPEALSPATVRRLEAIARTGSHSPDPWVDASGFPAGAPGLHPSFSPMLYYTLAQHAYLTGDAARLGRDLNAISYQGLEPSDMAAWRIAVMREWATTRGVSLREGSSPYLGMGLLTLVQHRLIGWLGLAAAVFAAAAMGLLGFLIFVLRRRARRLDDLLAAYPARRPA